MYKKASVYIGRFQPVHKGHIFTMKKALANCDKLIVVIGSHKSARDIKNPWTSYEREEMIKLCFTEEELENIRFIKQRDILYSDPLWVRNVEREVLDLVSEYGMTASNVSLVGCKKDSDTERYINQFKFWDFIDIERTDFGADSPLNSTKIRELLFTNHTMFVQNAVEPAVYQYLVDNSKTEEFRQTQKEYIDGVKYEKEFDGFPAKYNLNFLTTDAVVIQSGHILLIKRKNSPGKGLWALPGGHVNPNERIVDGCIRELIEEAGLKVPEKVLRGSIFCERNFDHPSRSLRARITRKNARTLTVAFGFRLDDSQPLPKLKAGDDAEDAWWFTFDEVENMSDQIFEDHYSIIEWAFSRAE